MKDPIKNIENFSKNVRKIILDMAYNAAQVVLTLEEHYQ